MSNLVKIELRNAAGEWVVAHAGIALNDPDAYVARLAERGQPARWRYPSYLCEDCGSQRCTGYCIL